jgi:protocatechuate 3,4-dioxygenase beta subunit
MESKTNRRNFLGLGLKGAGTLVALSGLTSKALAQSCGVLTPAQTAGPFYPGETNFGLDTDLTRVAGRSQRALGKVVYLKGRVLDAQCRPIEGANVEIWQANAAGRYNNPRDPNPAPHDPNFKYWAETYTDANGEYLFKTIIPGAYPAEPGWVRPPHIHFKVTKLGMRELVTQMYFKGDALNERDYILQQLPRAERESVIVDFVPSVQGLEPGTLTGVFDITLRSIRT